MPSSQKQTKNKWFFWKPGFKWSNFLFLPFLFLSIIFWLSTKLSNELQYRKSINIVYQTDDDLILKNHLPEKIDATLSGQGWELLFLDNYTAQNPFVFQIRSTATFISKADIISDLSRSLDNQKISVEDINFTSQSLEIEPKMTKYVPVYFDGKLDFADFYQLLGKVNFEPDSVKITGPESEIRKITRYPTANTIITDIQKDIFQAVPLKPSEKHYLTIDPMEVELRILTEQITQKTILVPVRIANRSDTQVTVVPEVIEINFLIGLSEFQYVSPDDFSAQIIVPEDRLPNQQYSVSIVKKPVNAEIQEITPAYVDVFFGQ